MAPSGWGSTVVRPWTPCANLALALVSWISLRGWDTVTAVIAAYAALALLVTILHIVPHRRVDARVPARSGNDCARSVRLGHATIVSVQRFVTWAFGLLTLAVLPWLVVRTHWSAVFGAPRIMAGRARGGVAIVAASAGISWTNLSADYSRQHRSLFSAGVQTLGTPLSCQCGSRRRF